MERFRIVVVGFFTGQSNQLLIRAEIQDKKLSLFPQQLAGETSWKSPQTNRLIAGSSIMRAVRTHPWIVTTGQP